MIFTAYISTFREMQGFYLLRAVLCAVGAVCLIAAHFLRAERRRAEKKLATFTRRVPGEIWWLAAALAVLSMVFSTGFGGYSPFEFWYYGWVGPTMTDALRLAALLPANAPALLALVWALWLRHITRKNTEREQRRSLLGAEKRILGKRLEAAGAEAAPAAVSGAEPCTVGHYAYSCSLLCPCV